jgi:hypothetical protein
MIVLLEACHLLDTASEFVDSKEPADGDGLEEGAPEEWYTTGPVKIHYLRNKKKLLCHAKINNNVCE